MTTVLMAGYNVGIVPCMVQAFGRLYIANGFDAMRVTDEGRTIRTVGIAAPLAAPAVAAVAGGAVGAGVHLVRIRYQDQARVRLSDPSTNSTITVVAGNQKVNVTAVASLDANVTHIIVEMTAAGATAFYRVATVVNTGAVVPVVMADATVLLQVTAARDGEFQHQRPPLCSLITEHRQRLWTWGLEGRTFSVTLTNGSPTVAGVGFSDQWAGLQLVDAAGVIYFILSSTTVAITLTSNYAGANAVANVTIRSGSPTALGWARAGYPESYDPVSYSRNITLETGDTPAGMASYFTDLYLIGKRSMRRLVFTSDPASGMLLTVPGTLGAFHQRCIRPAGAGLLFGWGREGMWKIEAMQPEKIGEDAEVTLASLADPARTNERFVAYEPTQRVVLFFFCLVGDTACKAAMAYHTSNGAWEIWRYRQAMTSACQNSSYLDRQRLMLSDANASSWRVGASVNDGGANGVMAADAGATTAVVPGANSAVVGQIAYRPLTSEERVITAAGPSSITVAPFATAPANGEAIYIGSIRQRIVTDWFIGGGLDDKKRPNWLLLMVRANRATGQAMGTLTVKLYRDFDDLTPTQVSNMSGDSNNYGISIVNGDTKITVDLDVGLTDGFVAVPLAAEWGRAIRAEIIAETPRDGVRFLDAQFSSDTKWVDAQVRKD